MPAAFLQPKRTERSPVLPSGPAIIIIGTRRPVKEREGRRGGERRGEVWGEVKGLCVCCGKVWVEVKGL